MFGTCNDSTNWLSWRYYFHHQLLFSSICTFARHNKLIGVAFIIFNCSLWFLLCWLQLVWLVWWVSHLMSVRFTLNFWCTAVFIVGMVKCILILKSHTIFDFCYKIYRKTRVNQYSQTVQIADQHLIPLHWDLNPNLNPRFQWHPFPKIATVPKPTNLHQFQVNSSE